MRLLPRWNLAQVVEYSAISRSLSRTPSVVVHKRHVQIQATPSADPSVVIEAQPPVGRSPDAIFEVLGAPYSLLSVSLSPSQDLHTRRGTLVGFSGNADGTKSSLQILNPLTRATLGIPFLYQKITSTSPINALISTKSPLTSFAVLHLDGTEDWKISQSNALLAWTGSSLHITPSVNLRNTISNWGSSNVTGRGLLALVGKGHIFAVSLKPGEQYIAHPSNVIAYSLSSILPRSYRFKSSTLRLQVSSLGIGRMFSQSNFIKNLQSSETWKTILAFAFRVRTWSRRTIWGDRLFLQFEGPGTILVQSRASRISDVLAAQEVNEIADAPPGVTQEAVKAAIELKSPEKPETASRASETKAPKLSYASIQRDGKVKIEGTKDFSQTSG